MNAPQKERADRIQYQPGNQLELPTAGQSQRLSEIYDLRISQNLHVPCGPYQLSRYDFDTINPIFHYKIWWKHQMDSNAADYDYYSLIRTDKGRWMYRVTREIRQQTVLGKHTSATVNITHASPTEAFNDPSDLEIEAAAEHHFIPASENMVATILEFIESFSPPDRSDPETNYRYHHAEPFHFPMSEIIHPN